MWQLYKHDKTTYLVCVFSFVYRKLMLTIDGNDDNYMPIRILVMGGDLHNLRKLNEEPVDQ